MYVYYELKADFLFVSIVAGTAAHILTAAWYLPLAYRWWSLSEVSKEP
ncbi:MAG: hypothetical protein KDB03_17145 [Planctomycetales bacterium]|nr:hypothetical protein [Planctomycetales bacterium]